MILLITFINYNVWPLVLIQCLKILWLAFLVTIFFFKVSQIILLKCTLSPLSLPSQELMLLTGLTICFLPLQLHKAIKKLVSNFIAQMIKLQNISGKTITWFSWVLLTMFWKETWCLIINHLDTARAVLAILVIFVSPEFTNENEWGSFYLPTNSPKPLLLLNRQQL